MTFKRFEQTESGLECLVGDDFFGYESCVKVVTGPDCEPKDYGVYLIPCEESSYAYKIVDEETRVCVKIKRKDLINYLYSKFEGLTRDKEEEENPEEENETTY